MNVRVFAAAALVASLAVVAVGASGASGGSAANTLTVWLQVDAQSGWPEVVAAANAQFKSQNPGWDVDVQYQTWGTHLAKFDATLAGNSAPDVIEMGNTEMTKYMAAGAFQDVTANSFPNKSTWLGGLAASGRFGGKIYGVPYYAGSRVVTYRTDLFKQVKAKIPTSQAEFMVLAKKLGAKNKDKAFSPVYIAGTDWYVAMSFVYDYGGKIAITRKGKWVGRSTSRPLSRASLLTSASSTLPLGRSKTTDEAHAARRTTSWPRAMPPRRTAPDGSHAASVTTRAKVQQFVMPSHTKGQPIPGFLGGSDLAVPIGGEQGQGRRVDQRLHGQRVDDRAPREGQHPEHDQPARHQRQRARGREELVRPDGEELGQRRERERPPHHAPADPHRQVHHQAGRSDRERQHHLHAESVRSISE